MLADGASISRNVIPETLDTTHTSSKQKNGRKEETRGDCRRRPEWPGGMQARPRQGLPPRGLRVCRRRRRRVEADARLHEAADAGVRVPVLRLPVAGAGGRRLGRGPLPAPRPGAGVPGRVRAALRRPGVGMKTVGNDNYLVISFWSFFFIANK